MQAPCPLRLILNGKKADAPHLRESVQALRERARIEVRCTWEAGDTARFVAEAIAEGVTRLAVGGGDGSIRDLVDAVMKVPREQRPELAVIPLGTANDFATAANIPSGIKDALALAQSGVATPVDCIRVNQSEHCINVASIGFGAQITATTPVALKNLLGGAAYTLSGLAQLLEFEPLRGQVRTPDEGFDCEIYVGAVCNGRQAGGGKVFAEQALLNNGSIELVTMRRFSMDELPQVFTAMQHASPSEPSVVQRRSVPWVEFEFEREAAVNLDGEPRSYKKVRFESVQAAVSMVLPEHTPVLGH